MARVNHRNPTNMPLHSCRHPRFEADYPRFRPPDPPTHRHHQNPNFIIKLCPVSKSSPNSVFVHDLVAKYCKFQPFKVELRSKPFEILLYFIQWRSALEAIVKFWESLLSGEHQLAPILIRNVIVPSDIDELNGRMRPLFSAKFRDLESCEVVKKWEDNLASLEKELDDITAVMRKRRFMIIRVFQELKKKEEGLRNEKKLIFNRIREFKAGVRCLLNYVVGDQEKGVILPFRFDNGVNWPRIYHMMMRECQRLEACLPIYAYRRELLQHISSQQITVLIGETGSGKSTQLVQFLVDSGLVAHGSIICTQPRKIAVTSLEQRLQEECYGCYDDDAIECYRSYSSLHQFNGKVIYMTDHCLLQHCMKDRMLDGVSCILVDEAHERTLNTDLLLAMLKKLLPLRPDMRLIIMSATADAKQLSDYFFGCGMFSVVGRSFSVNVKYAPCFPEGAFQSLTVSAGKIAPYVSDVLRSVTEIHRTEKEGTILAFLTSPMEVEWACEMLVAPDAVPLALHGKLSYEEQSQVFQDYAGKRKVIFATNVAETSLTIPGVKYVVDSGMAKECRFEPGSGMNVLRVCLISKSSANQRAGRAGRTESGCCYRLYSESNYDMMDSQQVPEIHRVHLGVAVLKIIALGIENISEFDFIDAPSSEAIDIATRNLLQLGAVTSINGSLKLTDLGQSLIKLGIEPRLGKLILGCFRMSLGKEGLVLAAVMTNASSIFCRVGSHEDKIKSDRLKVPFCHQDGDLFTLLSVYKAWENVSWGKLRKQWCWDNSINAKAMQRCHDTISEWESILKSELRIIVPGYWRWKPEEVTQHDRNLKQAILASLAENVAVYSGSDQLGYKVALSRQYVHLHPSCSLLMFNNKPDWVVFAEIVSTSCKYLACVTTFNQDFLSALTPPPLFDIFELGSQKLQVRMLSGFGKTLLKKFCGKYNNGLSYLMSRLRTFCGDERIRIEVDCDRDEIRLCSSVNMEKVLNYVKNALEFERRSLQNECLERRLYLCGPSMSPPVGLFGSGAEIKHLELDRRSLTVDVFHPNGNAVDEKELLSLIESNASGICAVHKFTSHVQDIEEREKWGSITFLSPDAARRVAELNCIEFNGSSVRLQLSKSTFGVERPFSFPAVKAYLSWPRRISRGVAIVKCEKPDDVDVMISQLFSLQIGERYVRCQASDKYPNSVVIRGIAKDASESEIKKAVLSATDRRFSDLFLIRGDAVEDPTCRACEEVLFREISAFMPKGSPWINVCRVQVFPPLPNNAFMRALITFDGRLHLEAAKALEQIEGKALPSFQSWQKVQCQRLFHTSVCCSYSVYCIIKTELHSLVSRFSHQTVCRIRNSICTGKCCCPRIECTLEKNDGNGPCRVKISATATKIVAELRIPVEELMRGKVVTHASLTPAVVQLLFCKDGITLMKALQQELGILIHFDRQSYNVRIIGTSAKIAVAEEQFIERLLNLQKNKYLEINLRGAELPHDLMKEVVKRFGPDLSRLKEKVPETELTLNTRRHVISICGTKEAKQKVEEIVNEIALASGSSREANALCGKDCPICLCEVEDAYQLESCMHVFCRSCLVEQCESATRNVDSFPICCAYEGCGVPIWLVDFKSLLSSEKLDELFWASVRAFVACSSGKFKFCPSPDCPSVYQVADADEVGEPFVCEVCYAEVCTKCHLEYHPYLSCEKYKEFKEDPDSSLRQWQQGKEDYVKRCPTCGHTIEKAEGCNHVECKCGQHLCWVCLEAFADSDDCYNHLRAIHQGIS